MQSKLDKIFHERQECLTSDQIENYNLDHMSPAEKNSVEKHLLECELCSDAVEGHKKFKKETETKIKSINPVLYWVSAAAAIIAFFVFIGLPSEQTPMSAEQKNDVQSEKVTNKQSPITSKDSLTEGKYISKKLNLNDKKEEEKDLKSSKSSTSKPISPKLLESNNESPIELEEEETIEDSEIKQDFSTTNSGNKENGNFGNTLKEPNMGKRYETKPNVQADLNDDYQTKAVEVKTSTPSVNNTDYKTQQTTNVVSNQDKLRKQNTKIKNGNNATLKKKTAAIKAKEEVTVADKKVEIRKLQEEQKKLEVKAKKKAEEARKLTLQKKDIAKERANKETNISVADDNVTFDTNNEKPIKNDSAGAATTISSNTTKKEDCKTNISKWEQELKKSPKNNELKLKLAKCYAKLGKKEKAKTLLKKIPSTSKHYKAAKKEIKLLE